MTDAPTPYTGPSRSILNHMVLMPRLHKMLLGLAALMAGGGTAGRVADYFSPPPAMQSSTASANGSSAAAAPSEAPQAAAPARSMSQRLAPWAQGVGIAFIVGFVVGWAFRVFIRTMALLTLAGVAIITGLSYFNILNVDFSSVEKKYESVMTWMTDQGERLGKGILHHLPGSASGFAGMFVGARRKR